MGEIFCRYRGGPALFLFDVSPYFYAVFGVFLVGDGFKAKNRMPHGEHENIEIDHFSY